MMIIAEEFNVVVEFTVEDEDDMKAARKEFKRRLMGAFMDGFTDPGKVGNVLIQSVKQR